MNRIYTQRRAYLERLSLLRHYAAARNNRELEDGAELNVVKL